ncbi:hypothetical protein [Polaromonas sp. AET17H-212]|nr:hypothetical protein [Polaromonas sp. AET17H-212]
MRLLSQANRERSVMPVLDRVTGNPPGLQASHGNSQQPGNAAHGACP